MVVSCYPLSGTVFGVGLVRANFRFSVFALNDAGVSNFPPTNLTRSINIIDTHPGHKSYATKYAMVRVQNMPSLWHRPRSFSKPRLVLRRSGGLRYLWPSTRAELCCFRPSTNQEQDFHRVPSCLIYGGVRHRYRGPAQWINPGQATVPNSSLSFLPIYASLLNQSMLEPAVYFALSNLEDDFRTCRTRSSSVKGPVVIHL